MREGWTCGFQYSGRDVVADSLWVNSFFLFVLKKNVLFLLIRLSLWFIISHQIHFLRLRKIVSGNLFVATCKQDHRTNRKVNVAAFVIPLCMWKETFNCVHVISGVKTCGIRKEPTQRCSHYNKFIDTEAYRTYIHLCEYLQNRTPMNVIHV